MSTLTNISLMIYFTLVSLIGTFGNGIILLAYGNRWNSSKSTSVIFILILACVDLWTCIIVVPSIAIMEYRDFEVPTILCRFYSFSKILIITSSLIMSFIALDRFLNIAVPHHRLLNPCRVKFLLTLFILIGIGLGILTALAFSSAPFRELYLANYHVILSNDPYIVKNDSHEISLLYEQKNISSDELFKKLEEQISLPNGAYIVNVNLSYITTYERCFADTTIISETIREILRHISNKYFFISIGIVTIFYTITFILALHRQNPRIRALKKSLNILSKFDSYPSNKNNHHQLNNKNKNNQSKQRTDSILSYSPLCSTRKNKPLFIELKRLSVNDNQQCEISSFISEGELEDQNVLHKPKQDYTISVSEATSDDLQVSHEKLPTIKQVSFQVDNPDDQQQLGFLSNSDIHHNNETYYKFPCPCSTTRQLLIKFHFAQPTLDINQWLCCCCCIKKSPSKMQNVQQAPIINPVEDETSITLSPTSPTNNDTNYNNYTSNSKTLKKQLHRHRIKQIRMASTFLLITVSFVLFYLPSILAAERIIKSPIMIYYLYLCTHALNPIIYCFMNMNLRAYAFSMLRCRKKQRRRNVTSGTTIFERS